MASVALLTPFAAPSVRGNAVTVGRIARGLRQRGLDVRVWDLSVTPAATIEAEVQGYRPALLHAFHARQAGPLALDLAGRLGVPLVVTLTGTDANHDLVDADRAAAVRRVLDSASLVTAFHESIVEQVTRTAPALRSRLLVVPQSVEMEGAAPFTLPARWAVPADRVLFVFAGGIRVVKAPRRPLAPLDAVAAADARLRLLYAGPIIDPREGDALLHALAPRPWAHHVGAVPPTQMASLLAQADVVLNCSVSEGGMANSLLEALALARAVLVSDVPGNRALVQNDVTGLTFADDAELATKARRLAQDAALRARLGRAGRALVEREYPIARELDGYLGAYRRVTAAVASA
jgi:glycosyltransferase involved in cell wall biosynthesis